MLHGHWAIISGGQKENHFDLIHYGCDGYLSTLVTFAPQITQAYWKAVQAGELGAAAGVIRDYDMPYFNYVLKVEGSFDAALHGTYELFGLAQRWRRPPYHTLTDEQMDELSHVLGGCEAAIGNDQPTRRRVGEVGTAFVFTLTVLLRLFNGIRNVSIKFQEENHAR